MRISSAMIGIMLYSWFAVWAVWEFRDFLQIVFAWYERLPTVKSMVADLVLVLPASIAAGVAIIGLSYTLLLVVYIADLSIRTIHATIYDTIFYR